MSGLPIHKKIEWIERVSKDNNAEINKLKIRLDEVALLLNATVEGHNGMCDLYEKRFMTESKNKPTETEPLTTGQYGVTAGQFNSIDVIKVIDNTVSMALVEKVQK